MDASLNYVWGASFSSTLVFLSSKGDHWLGGLNEVVIREYGLTGLAIIGICHQIALFLSPGESLSESNACAEFILMLDSSYASATVWVSSSSLGGTYPYANARAPGVSSLRLGVFAPLFLAATSVLASLPSAYQVSPPYCLYPCFAPTSARGQFSAYIFLPHRALL